MIKRKLTKKIRIGNVYIGGNSPVLVQSMTNTITSNIKATVKQIKELEKAGCEIIRVAVPDIESARAIKEIKKQIKIPLVADIHFSSILAIKAIEAGADKIRINPGNFPKADLKTIIDLANTKNIPIRIGVNAGSLEKELLGKHKKVTPQMMVKSAMQSVKLMESLGFYNLVIALKASDVLRTVEAHKLLAKKTDYPVHLGITEAGTEFSGSIKSAIGIGTLLLNGIGDTLRVSLSANPVEEVRVAFEILKSLEIREKGIKIISCPTCGRAQIDVISIAKAIEDKTKNINKPIKVAIMGCVVNGLGEGKEVNLAVIGLAKKALIMKDGVNLKEIEKNTILETLEKLIKEY